jgi:hypothetical protein
MKKHLLILSLTSFVLVATILSGSAQIIIDNTDMPAVHDEYLVNSATPTPAIDPVPTGANFLWDFSSRKTRIHLNLSLTFNPFMLLLFTNLLTR